MLVLSTFLTASAEENGLTLYYPSYMQASEGETLMLAEKPERIVCLSNAALQILVRCDIHPIAVTSLSSSITYPDWGAGAAADHRFHEQPGHRVHHCHGARSGHCG